MHIAMIAAMAHNRVIGKDNQMPWHLPDDLRHFKAMTLGKPVIMGRRTFESIGRPLPGRCNIVVSRQQDYHADGITLVASLQDALLAAGQVEEVVVIGGGQLYREALPLAQRLYLTEIDLEVAGDTTFPEWDDGSWQLESETLGESEKGLKYRFISLMKKY
ncbi:type 3 dihydrofolate reductase [Shewanella avicenniae]|uniref:Dihydrofolate reductase n=1 Tax=Shewanella avicenniae TaxID=2814294 RepID=A0ABX7QQ98_9GAMM|nr:type 3 dihydrofolate reductase [Shewanella avicenniae]QSX32888.1 type 3 dihydrofolate reductase [Shewanella avicenniae]